MQLAIGNRLLSDDGSRVGEGEAGSTEVPHRSERKE